MSHTVWYCPVTFILIRRMGKDGQADVSTLSPQCAIWALWVLVATQCADGHAGGSGAPGAHAHAIASPATGSGATRPVRNGLNDVRRQSDLSVLRRRRKTRWSSPAIAKTVPAAGDWNARPPACEGELSNSGPVLSPQIGPDLCLWCRLVSVNVALFGVVSALGVHLAIVILP